MTPEEYNAQLQALQAKRSIANAMLTQSIAQGQGWGNDRFAHSPLEAIANIGSTYLNKRSVDNADQATKAATTSRQAEIADALTKYQSATPDAQSSALQGLARTALGPDQMAQMSIQQAMTPDKLTEVAPGSSLYNQRLGKVTYTAPAKPAEAPTQAKEYEYAKQNGFTGSFLEWQQRAQRPEVTADIQGYNLAQSQGYKGSYLDYKKQVGQTAKGGSFNEQSGALLASFAAHGVSLPAGLRSKEQQIATINGLLAKFPDKSPDEIAEAIANGQINFGSDKKSATVAAGQEGKVATAVNELSLFGDQALAASAKVPRGNFIPATQLLQMADTSISDPNLLTLKLKLNALNNAYNVLSARGGTDAESRKHVAQLFASATGPEGIEALVKGLKEEGAGAKSAAREASHVSPGTSTSAAGAVPDDIAALLKKHGGG
jgi:hypothetical protein